MADRRAFEITLIVEIDEEYCGEGKATEVVDKLRAQCEDAAGKLDCDLYSCEVEETVV